MRRGGKLDLHTGVYCTRPGHLQCRRLRRIDEEPEAGVQHRRVEIVGDDGRRRRLSKRHAATPALRRRCRHRRGDTKIYCPTVGQRRGRRRVPPRRGTCYGCAVLLPLVSNGYGTSRFGVERGALACCHRCRSRVDDERRGNRAHRKLGIKRS